MYARLAVRGQDLQRWLRGWWTIVFVGAQLMVLAFSPSSYSRGAHRMVAYHLYRATGAGLLSFTLITALFNVVTIRVVVVGAQGYGVSQFALDAVVRTLVLELIPLTAALFVAIQYTVPGGTELYKLRRDGALAARATNGRDPLSYDVLPRVLGGVFAVLFLSLLSCLISLVLAYLIIYGFTHWGMVPYTRAVGHIFSPAMSIILTAKTVLFGLIVALLPVGTAMQDWPRGATRTSVELQGLVRMLVLLLLVETLALMGNYY